MEPAPKEQRTVPADHIVASNTSDRLWKELDEKLFPRDVAEIIADANLGDLRRQEELFSRMEDTWPHLAKALKEVKSAISRVPYSVTPYTEKGQEPTPSAVEKAALVERALWSMQPRDHHLEEDMEGTIFNLADAIGKAVSVSEIYWQQTPHGLLPRATKKIPANYYGFPGMAEQADRLMLNLQGFRKNRTGLSEFPENKFLIGIHNHRSGHPSQTALLRVLARLWCMRTYSEKWMASYAEVFGQPIRWATYDPTNKALLGEITAMLEGMGSAGWGAFPTGTTIELKEPSRGAAENPQKLIQDIADQACDILILGQTLTTDVGSSGSRALGETHQSVRYDVLKSYADWVCRVLRRQLASFIVSVNYGSADEVPVIGHDLREAKDEKAMAERDKILFQDMGLPVEKAYLYERHSIPVPDAKATEESLFQKTSPAAMPGQNDSRSAPAVGRGTAGVSARESSTLKGSSVLIEARRRAENSRLAETVAERVSGVSATWLGPVKPIFAELVAKAQDEKITDADFIQAVEAASKSMPELFSKLDTDALADAMEAAMGAAAINGAIQSDQDKGGTS